MNWKMEGYSVCSSESTPKKPNQFQAQNAWHDFPAFADLPACVRKEGIFGNIFCNYLADYHDIRRITMIFVPGLPTEPGQEITEKELICVFFTSSFPVTRLEILKTAIYGLLVTSPFSVPFRLQASD